jgi:hypothetical protein
LGNGGKTQKLIILCAGGVFIMAMSAGAATVNYTVSAWGPNQYPAPTAPPEGAPWGVNGYPGDTLGLVTYTGTLELTPGIYELKINTLDWTINYTYGGTETAWDYPNHWSDVLFSITAIRSISFNAGPAGSLSQTGLLTCKWDDDYLTFNDGTTASFNVQGYAVEVTPLGLSPVAGSNFSGSNPWVQPEHDVMARFDVVLVPEPATICLLALGSLALGRKRKS